MEVSDSLHVLASLLSGKRPRYQQNGRLCERKMRSESFGEEKDHLLLSWVEKRILGSPQHALYQLPKLMLLL
jgi:hypothetical protein